MSNDPIDFPALAALRPGEAKDELARAMGRRWRELAPHQEGMVVSIARTDEQNAMPEVSAETTTAA